MRVVFDVSTTARRSGSPAGISRVEWEFANCALINRPDIDFSFYDPAAGNFRAVRREWVSELTGPEATLDTSLLQLAYAAKRKARFGPPGTAQTIVSWFMRPRRRMRVALERLRMTASSPAVRRFAERTLWLQQPRSAAIVPFDVVMGNFLSLSSDCVLVSVGNDWGYKNAEQIARMKEQFGFRYVILCHDLIMLQFPELIGMLAADIAKRYWLKAFPLADLVVFTSRKVEEDVRGFCAAHGLPLGDTARVPLGADPARFCSSYETAIPAGIEPNRYVLMVSTVAPRKGHEVLIRVWNRLYAEGVPQAYGFRLVLVGKVQGGVPEAERLLAERTFGDTLVHLTNVPDAQLAALYRNAAFCVYPSLYEGYGLPIVEAFSFGKAVIASNGGAVPEVVDGLSPCLDPLDEAAWYAEIKQWIIDTGRRGYFENKIGREFRMRSWREAASDFFDVIGKWASEARRTATPASEPTR